jgi:hypothetical protein
MDPATVYQTLSETAKVQRWPSIRDDTPEYRYRSDVLCLAK